MSSFTAELDPHAYIINTLPTHTLGNSWEAGPSGCVRIGVSVSISISVVQGVVGGLLES